MKRLQQKITEGDLEKKLVFLVWPRQVWKTFLAKEIAKKYKNPVYLNYDRKEDREIIKNESWLSKIDLLIFDEIHKMPNWKSYLKGIFDTKENKLKILVTWSARLDTFRQSWDSLAWRFYLHRLLPFSLKEILSSNDKKKLLFWKSSKNELIERLMKRWWFPESFLSKNDKEAERWRSQYTDSLIREDVLDFENIHNLKTMNLLFKLLQERVWSPISYSSLATDLDISPHTAKKYIDILEALHIIFRVFTYSKNIARSIKKESKIYFFDNWLVKWDEWILFENLVANALLKNCFWLNDSDWKKMELKYLRTKDWREVDFCIINDDIKELLIEVKYSDWNFAKNLIYFSEKYWVNWVQVVRDLKRERRQWKLELISWESFLWDLEF